MMPGDIGVELHGHVGVIELQRPPTNYFDHDLIAQLVEAAFALQTTGEARALVLCSQGRHFCAGADFSSDGIGDDRENVSRQLYREALRLFDVELPIIAAVQGSAVGGGLGLACAADFRVATPASRLTANFAQLGFHHGFALSVTLPRIVGHQTAQDLLYSGRRLTGTEAQACGLVDRLADDGEERSTAIAWAAELAANAPLAVRAIKMTLRSDIRERVHAALDRELAEQHRLWQTEDSAIGIAASLKRERPTFVGR
jgi:enoyl-CoA hydratase/carnithine racemase